VKDEYLFIKCPLLNIRAPCLSGVLIPLVCVGWKFTVLSRYYKILVNNLSIYRHRCVA
jgi:hypothetical protein